VRATSQEFAADAQKRTRPPTYAVFGRAGRLRGPTMASRSTSSSRRWTISLSCARSDGDQETLEPREIACSARGQYHVEEASLLGRTRGRARLARQVITRSRNELPHARLFHAKDVCNRAVGKLNASRSTYAARSVGETFSRRSRVANFNPSSRSACAAGFALVSIASASDVRFADSVRKSLFLWPVTRSRCFVITRSRCARVWDLNIGHAS
jgi:hypothetical protein